MPRLTTAIAVACLLVIPVVASAGDPLYSPVTTFTNGMLLPQATPLRSHNVYYQCDPGHIGCCGGRYNRPCLNSLYHPNDCCNGSRPAPSGAWAPEQVTGAMQAVESVRFEQLGSVPNAVLGVPGAGAPEQRAPAVPSLLQRLTQ